MFGLGDGFPHWTEQADDASHSSSFPSFGLPRSASTSPSWLPFPGLTGPATDRDKGWGNIGDTQPSESDLEPEALDEPTASSGYDDNTGNSPLGLPCDPWNPQHLSATGCGSHTIVTPPEPCGPLAEPSPLVIPMISSGSVVAPLASTVKTQRENRVPPSDDIHRMSLSPLILPENHSKPDESDSFSVPITPLVLPRAIASPDDTPISPLFPPIAYSEQPKVRDVPVSPLIIPGNAQISMYPSILDQDSRVSYTPQEHYQPMHSEMSPLVIPMAMSSSVMTPLMLPVDAQRGSNMPPDNDAHRTVLSPLIIPKWHSETADSAFLGVYITPLILPRAIASSDDTPMSPLVPPIVRSEQPKARDMSTSPLIVPGDTQISMYPLVPGHDSCVIYTPQEHYQPMHSEMSPLVIPMAMSSSVVTPLMLPVDAQRERGSGILFSDGAHNMIMSPLNPPERRSQPDDSDYVMMPLTPLAYPDALPQQSKVMDSPEDTAMSPLALPRVSSEPFGLQEVRTSLRTLSDPLPPQFVRPDMRMTSPDMARHGRKVQDTQTSPLIFPEYLHLREHSTPSPLVLPLGLPKTPTEKLQDVEMSPLVMPPTVRRLHALLDLPMSPLTLPEGIPQSDSAKRPDRDDIGSAPIHTPQTQAGPSKMKAGSKSGHVKSSRKNQRMENESKKKGRRRDRKGKEKARSDILEDDNEEFGDDEDQPSDQEIDYGYGECEDEEFEIDWDELKKDLEFSGLSEADISLFERLSKKGKQRPLTQATLGLYFSLFWKARNTEEKKRRSNDKGAKKRKPATQIDSRPAERLEFLGHIRSRMELCMDRQKDDPMDSRFTPKRKTLARYAASRRPEDGPQIQKLKLDVANGSYKTSLWNQRVKVIFVDNFLERTEYRDVKMIEKSFWNHVKALGMNYNRHRKKSKSQRKAELEARKKRNSKQRKRHLLLRRFGATNRYKYDGQICTLYQHFKDGDFDDIQSEDEDDHGTEDTVVQRLYRLENAKRDSWMHSAVIWMLRGLDSLHLSTKYNSDLLPNRGAMPHQPDGPLEPPPPDPTIQAVPKLPRNFYRDDYWNLLAKDAQKRLEVQPSIDLEFSIHITRKVAQFKERPPLRDDDPSLPPDGPCKPIIRRR